MKDYYNLKNEYKNSIILIKIRLFYNTYNEDTIIIHNLTKYKLYNNNGIICTSFTDKSIDLVLSRLRSMNVSYIVKTSKELTKYIGRVTSYKELLNKTNKKLKEIGFKYVTLDMAGYEMGSMNK